MKTNSTLKTSLTTSLILLATSTAAFAQVQSQQYETQQVNIQEGNLVNNIGSFHLKGEGVVEALSQSKPYFADERKVMLGFSIGAAPTQEGIPGTHNVPDPSDLIKNAYSTATVIARALEKAQTLDSGARIRHFEAVAKRVVAVSGKSDTEQAVRMTMNRAVDTANNVIAIMGRNTDYVRDLIGLFYEENFKLAAAYANNPVNLSYFGNEAFTTDRESVSLAEFGRVYATMMWNFSAGLTSDSSKAVFLMKMMGYFGWDLNLDLKRTSYRELIADIYLMQTEDPAYLAVLEKLRNKQEPSQAQLAGLRNSVRQIYDRIIPTFQQAGTKVGMVR